MLSSVFLIFSSPTSPANSFHWPRFDMDTELYAALKPALFIRSHLLADKMAFWNELVPSLSRSADPYSSPSPSPAPCTTVTCPRCPKGEGTSGNSWNGRFVQKPKTTTSFPVSLSPRSFSSRSRVSLYVSFW